MDDAGRTRGVSELSQRAQSFFHEQALDDGWVAWNLKQPGYYNAFVEPLSVRREADTPDGRPVARVRMQPASRHANLGNVLHGGATLGFIDVALFASLHQFGVLNVGPAVTLDLATQFIGPGKLDQPLDALTELVRETGRLAFLRGMLVQGAGDAHIVASYTGTIRKASPGR